MKRVLIALLLLLSIQASAQLDTLPKFTGGIRVGATLTDMRYTYEGYSDYEHSGLIGPDLGLYARTRFAKHWSLRSDVSFMSRGTNLTWCDVNYQFTSYYVDLRLPVQYNFLIKKSEVSPYIMAGPMLNFAVGGKINYSSDWTPLTSFDITKGSLKPIDFGVLLGIGMDWTFDINYRPFIFSFEVVGGLGLLNNYAKTEVEGTSGILNPEPNTYMNYGNRYHQGVGVALMLSMPNYIRPPKVSVDELGLRMDLEDTPEEIEIDYESIPQDAPAFNDEPTPVNRGYEYKECYSIDDILEMAEDEVNIENLRICLFDINFAFDSYELTRGSEMKLNKIVKLLRMYPEMRIKVNGHTDNYGSDEYNDRLSNNRALEVAGYISSRGIYTGRLEYEGYGEKYPIDTNETDEGRWHNRRVEIEILSMGPRKK